MIPVSERVAAGATWLDEQHPDWWQQIDLGRLDINSVFACILGQLYGDYGAAVDRFGWSLEATVNDDIRPQFRMGLTTKLASDSGRVDIDDMLALNAEWKRVIRERRAA